MDNRKSIIKNIFLCVLVLSMFGCTPKDKTDVVEQSRTIHNCESFGNVFYTRDDVTESVYSLQLFVNEDILSTKSNSFMTLRLDRDMYLRMNENTDIELVAEGTNVNSKTNIFLKNGSVDNTIKNKLNDSSSYEIETANATISVRGTVFNVSYLDGVTEVLCHDGTVEITDDNGSKTKLNAGQKTTITDEIEDIQEISYIGSFKNGGVLDHRKENPNEGSPFSYDSVENPTLIYVDFIITPEPEVDVIKARTENLVYTFDGKEYSNPDVTTGGNAYYGKLCRTITFETGSKLSEGTHVVEYSFDIVKYFDVDEKYYEKSTIKGSFTFSLEYIDMVNGTHAEAILISQTIE